MTDDIGSWSPLVAYGEADTATLFCAKDLVSMTRCCSRESARHLPGESTLEPRLILEPSKISTNGLGGIKHQVEAFHWL